MKETKFFLCQHCGNLVEVINDGGVTPVCCGEEMTEVVAGSKDASLEKHVPVITIDGNRVTVEVGAAPHPMIPEHYITWVYLKTDKGTQRKMLSPADEPKAVFLLEDDKALAAYEYCNIHGLWMAEV